MLTAIITGGIAGFGVLGTGYGITRHYLHQEPISAIITFFREKDQNKEVTVDLSRKKEELEKKEQALKERSDYLDQRYNDLVDDAQITQEQFEDYKQMMEKESREWQALQEKQPHEGQEAVLELVKRDAAARTGAKGFYKYLHDHRNAMTDTQYLTYRTLLGLITTEFSGSELGPFAINLFRFLSRNGYNPYLIAWILMVSLKEI